MTAKHLKDDVTILDMCSDGGHLLIAALKLRLRYLGYSSHKSKLLELTAKRVAGMFPDAAEWEATTYSLCFVEKPAKEPTTPPQQNPRGKRNTYLPPPPTTKKRKLNHPSPEQGSDELYELLHLRSEASSSSESS